jgi:hypothetical protein
MRLADGAASGDWRLSVYVSGPGIVMDMPAGFTTGFSFFYAAYYGGSASVYSGSYRINASHNISSATHMAFGG